MNLLGLTYNHKFYFSIFHRGQKRFDRSFPSHYEETGNPQNPKMYQRSFSSENWRDRDEDDDNGDWRKAGGSKWSKFFVQIQGSHLPIL